MLAAYDTLPLLQFVDTDVKRKSLDFTVAPGVMDDILSTDPLFVLRIAREKRKEEGVVPLGTPRGWQPSVLNRSTALSVLVGIYVVESGAGQL